MVDILQKYLSYAEVEQIMSETRNESDFLDKVIATLQFKKMIMCDKNSFQVKLDSPKGDAKTCLPKKTDSPRGGSLIYRKDTRDDIVQQIPRPPSPKNPAYLNRIESPRIPRWNSQSFEHGKDKIRIDTKRVEIVNDSPRSPKKTFSLTKLFSSNA
jgi:hypothetical protein